jgi:hypothetical protein
VSVLVVILVASIAFATPIAISIDTAAIAGTTGQLAFDLIDWDAVVNSSIQISDFSTTGTLGASAFVGGVIGTLPPGVLLTDTDFFNEFLQTILFGNSIDMTLDFATTAAGLLPDGFALFLLDATGSASLISTDLTGDALLTADLVDGNVLIRLSGTTRPNDPAVFVSVVPSAVPTPPTLLLLGVAVVVASGVCRRRFICPHFGSTRPDLNHAAAA